MLVRILKGIGWSLAIGFMIVLMLIMSDNVNQYPSPLPPERLLIPKPTVAFSPPKTNALIEELKMHYGKNKQLPEGYEIPALLALSHYPELEEVPIQFEITETLIPLASRPDATTVLFPWEDRKYKVVISSKSIEMLEPILLHNLSFNAQIGVIGHELAHTVDYLDKTSADFSLMALQYLFSEYRKQFERNTDLRTIRHGLGYQLLAWSKEVKAAFDGNLQKSTMDSTYLSPQEIEAVMDSLRLYR